MTETAPLLIAALAFAAVTALVYAAGQYYATSVQMRRRLALPAQAAAMAGPSGQKPLHRFITTRFAEEKFGIDALLRGRLRRELLKAGYFAPEAINYYIFARVLSVLALPTLAFVLSRLFLPAMAPWLEILVAGAAALIGVAGPDAYLARRTRLLEQEYRRLFPDFIDLLLVCVSAGLSIDAGIERIREPIALRCAELGANLEMMGAETRAGRTTVEALDGLADRLGLDEAVSFVAVLRQSMELGGDVGTALRVFSTEDAGQAAAARRGGRQQTVGQDGPAARHVYLSGDPGDHSAADRTEARLCLEVIGWAWLGILR